MAIPFLLLLQKQVYVDRQLQANSNLNHKWPTRWAFRSHLFQPLSTTFGFYEQTSSSRQDLLCDVLNPFIQLAPAPSFPSILGLGLGGELPFQFGNCSISSPAVLRSGGETARGWREPPERLRLAWSPRWS